MDHLIINGVKPYDGRYDLDLSVDLTTREWGWIKRLAGYLPLGLTDEAFGDPELGCVLAIIALRRAGRIQPSEVPGVFERLADAPFGSSIRIETGAEEQEVDEGRPPPASSNGSTDTSGTASPASSASSAPTRKATGTRGSGTSASGPRISAS